ncbi:hypothetical protein AAIG39_12500 [Phytobacter palmae]|uniref:Uncharacterized protein n=1 Tax=Phytobacter palmae TaxID=1855371 RepID=A0ABU9V5W2_9ENTR
MKRKTGAAALALNKENQSRMGGTEGMTMSLTLLHYQPPLFCRFTQRGAA